MSGTPQLEAGRDILLIIPTHCHPTCLPIAIESARQQSVEAIDIVVIGDGVDDDTRDVVAPICAGDERVQFLDLPKAVRHGEEYRDAVIRQSAASIVTYLGDDDLLFPHHVETMKNCVKGVDFANPLPIFVRREWALDYVATDLSNPDSVAWHLNPRSRRNSVSLTGATHTRESYLRLPHGWRPTPPDRWTDHYMWEQFFQLEGFTGRTSSLATTAKLSQSDRKDMTPEARAAELMDIANRMRDPDFLARWDAEVGERVRRDSVMSLLRISEVEARPAT